jgi:hypothetical protein
MDAARRRLRAVSDHIRPPAPAAGCGGIYANPTAAGEYAAHGEPRPALLLSSVQVVFMPAMLCWYTYTQSFLQSRERKSGVASH